MQQFDVVMVGGGPAGSSCAWKLRKAGLTVLLLDKKQFPRVKPCAGWITPPVLQALDFDVQAYRQNLVLQPITGFRTGIIGGPQIETRYGRPVSYGILRREFDDYLLTRSGVQREFVAVKSLQREGDRWLINDQFQTPLLVGAGGHFCPVARHLGARQGGAAPVVVAQEAEFEVSPKQCQNLDPETPELFFCQDLLGYGWCFRKGNFLNIGLGRINSNRLSEQVTEFCDFLQREDKIQCDIPSHFLGHAYQLYERAQPKLVAPGALLIGDAAGLAYSHSGEGIRPAVESALIAADVIIEAGGVYTEQQLMPYQTRLTQRLGKPAKKRAALGLLPAAWLHGLASRLMATRWFARRVILDDWFLHRRQGALDSAAQSRSSSDQ